MTTVARPGSAAELADVLRGRPGRVRLVGTGSRQNRLPEADGAVRFDLSGLDRIERLEADDLTCSVGAGVPREQLDAALRERGVCLPCAGGGSLGGLFASDPIGATTAGGPAPRTLLLGIEGVQADGTPFRSGARVVKSVAGFDVHRLLVGSCGRLFAAAVMHLKLRPLPRATVWFTRDGLDLARAFALFQRLRTEAVPPAVLELRGDGDGFTVRGRVDGRPGFVRDTLRRHELAEVPPLGEHHLAAGPGEVLAGVVPPSRTPALLAAAPAEAPFLLRGGGRFELATPSPAASDDLLARLPALGAHACVTLGAGPRRGTGTPLDPGASRLTAALTRSFDPDGILV